MISAQVSSVIVSLSITQVALPSSTRSRVVADLSSALKRAGTPVTLKTQPGTTNR
jgi:hypothetical protein